MQVVWCAARILKTNGVQYNPGKDGAPGDVVTDADKLPGFLSMRNQGMLEPWIQRDDGTLRPVVYKARRYLPYSGGRYLPGDVLPDEIRNWPSFNTLRKSQWSTGGYLEPITDPALLRKLLASEIAPPSEGVGDAAPAPGGQSDGRKKHRR